MAVDVSVIDVIASEDESHIVVMLDEAGQRLLPIWVGPFEGRWIAFLLSRESFGRPLTYQFAGALLEAAGASLEEVRIEALRKDVFYAAARVRSSDQVREVDARPSDAIALALHLGSPIRVAEEVFASAAMALDGEQAAALRRGRSLPATIEPVLTNRARFERAAQRSPEEAAQERAENEQRLLAYLTGESETF